MPEKSDSCRALLVPANMTQLISQRLSIYTNETNKLFDVNIAYQPQFEVLIYALVFTSGNVCCLKSYTASIIGTWCCLHVSERHPSSQQGNQTN